MRLFATAVASVIFASLCNVQAAKPRGVLAHFMVGNTASFTSQDWINNIEKAAGAGIQGFALNMAADWYHNEAALELAFPAAGSRNFKLIFSFDYAGNGPWKQDTVIKYIQKYGSNSAYWQHDGKPLVSTFEGPDNAQDWVNIKATTGCFFMPDWSSKGAGPALALANGVADGLFSWAAWPWGSRRMDTYTDHSYTMFLGNSKPYMMAVSPWFFTNLPGYNKNWLWGGGNLWYERWQQVWEIQPDYVQIISWNDFGESHYIGPLDDRQYEAFTIGEAPFNYVKDFEHTGWLVHLPFMIQTYLSGNSGFSQESLVLSHHVTSAKACSGGGTTGNTASHLQLEFAPEEISVNRVYIAALLSGPAALTISDGGSITNVAADKWDIMPDGGIGLYYTSVPFNSGSSLSVQIQRGGSVLKELSTSVQQSCSANGASNFNAKVVSGAWGSASKRALYTPTLSRSQKVCIQGWGEGVFDDLCQFACRNGYCPDSCVCLNMGKQRQTPEPTYEVGYPANGDDNYAGLCSFSCNLGHCPKTSCSNTKQPQYIPATSPFLPATCTAGYGVGDFSEACEYGCKYGYCPRNVCVCTSTGVLNLPPPITNSSITWELFKKLSDAGVCQFACSRGSCPSVCSLALGTAPGIFVPIDPSNSEPYDFSTWIKAYAAIGDSFAAGIGVGDVRPEKDAKDCSRYTGAYPLKLQDTIQAEHFQFVACSGDTIRNISENQFKKLLPWSLYERSPKFNLFTVSAGGNDVGFSDVLKSCIFLWSTIDQCNAAIADAEAKIDSQLAPAATYLLQLIEAHLYPIGVIAWTLYAKFFDESPEPCNSQVWCFIDFSCLKISVEMRQSLNRLVGKANKVLLDTFDEYNKGRKGKKVFPVAWGGFVAAADGQFCEADSADNYDDFTNSKLAFIRPSLDVPPLRTRDNVTLDESEYDNPTAVKHWERDTSRWVPDSILQNFHPNELGTIYQASTAIGVIAQAWEEYNAIQQDSSCPMPDAPEPAPAPPYEKGTCSFHLSQWNDCNEETKDYSCEVRILDNAKNEIGHAPKGSCNAEDPMGITSKLPLLLLVTGQHTGDYVQFSYGSQSWKSNDKAWCSQGAWDPKFDDCIGSKGTARKREMDCSFQC